MRRRLDEPGSPASLDGVGSGSPGSGRGARARPIRTLWPSTSRRLGLSAGEPFDFLSIAGTQG